VVKRAWPFEDHVDPVPEPRSPRDFAARAAGDVEAVVIRLGLSGAQAVFVTASGSWRRWVYPTVDAALEAARAAGCRVHEGEFPEPVRVRLNAHRRPAEDFDRAPYPEQGWVGPVNFYPENRPRPEKKSETTGSHKKRLAALARL
jgi:hypothetical protein